MEIKDLKEMRDQLDHKERKVLQEIEDLMVFQDHKVQWD